MNYKELVDVYERLENTTKKLEKRDILADLYKNCPKKFLFKVVQLSMGNVSMDDLGIAREMMKRVIIKTTGISEKELTEKFKKTGDLGYVAEYFIKNKKQRSLLRKDLTVDKVFENLEKLPKVTGKGSQERKMSLVSELLSNAAEKESRYIVRTTLGDMRIGVAEGIVRDALAMAFKKEPKDLENVYNIVGNYGKVAELAAKGSLEMKMEIGSPIRVMLAERASDLKNALEKFDRPAIEVKYDGFRIQIHKDDSMVKVFSRRMEDVTKQFPEVAEWSKKFLSAKQCIVEGEVIAIGPLGQPKPFQHLSRRIQRKHDIDKMVKEIPVQVNLFDLIYCDKKDFMKKPFSERWSRLKEIMSEKKNTFQLASHIETTDIGKAEDFYQKSLEMGEEGVIIKNLSAHYQPGKRVGFWLKVKPIMEPLDLVVVGAEWGEGKRARWLGSLVLAARSGSGFMETCRMASGLTEDQMEDLTKILKKLIISEEGKIVKVKPQVVVEIGYEEIQASPKYESGYALRFPRLLRIRTDEKKPEDANTIKDIERLYKQQRGRK